MLVPRAPWTFSVAPWPVDAHPTAVIRAIVVENSDFRAAIPAIPPPSYRRATTRAGVAAELPGHHQSSFMSPAGHSERVAEVLDRSCCSRAPASDGTAQSVSEKGDVRNSHIQLVRARAAPVSDHSRSWPTMAGRLARLGLCFSHSRRHAVAPHFRTRSASTRVFRIARCGARTPPPCVHDAHLVGRSERRADGARARPVHAPARAPSARRERVSAHFGSSPRRERVRTPSSRRGRLRSQSAPLRACNGPGRASSLRRAQKPSGPMPSRCWFHSAN